MTLAAFFEAHITTFALHVEMIYGGQELSSMLVVGYRPYSRIISDLEALSVAWREYIRLVGADIPEDQLNDLALRTEHWALMTAVSATEHES